MLFFSFLVSFLLAHHCFFFFNDAATTEIYTLSLHDALPITCNARSRPGRAAISTAPRPTTSPDRKSTRLNSSHITNSYAVFCLKKKKKHPIKPLKQKYNFSREQPEKKRIQ